jgi:type I restriction enzyme S subunit
MKGWKECELNEVLKFGNGKARPQTTGIYPVYGGNGILDYCDKTNYNGETIIIGRVGAYCGATYYESSPIWISDNALSAKPKDGNDTKFLYYLLLDLNLNQYAEGSSHPLLTQTLLNTITTTIPIDSTEQKAIASVLGSLDDKIDLLTRQNRTLESIAETLFRQWFIEEAKNDWEEGTLFDLIELHGGGTPKTDNDEYWNGAIKWISAKDITPNHRGIIVETEKTISEKGLSNSSTRLLPKFATIVSARGTVGNYCILPEQMAFSQSNYGIFPCDKATFFFTYLLIAHSIEELKMSAYGSVFDTITTNTFKELQVKVPSHKMICEFEKIVSPFFYKKIENVYQIQTLKRTRDTLLPKLMKGDIRTRY